MSFKFHREERLCSRKVITELYESGNNYNSKCFRVTWKKHELPEKFPAQLLISVSKRNFKKAVSRNRIKRLIREAYRKNKQMLYNALNATNIKIVFSLSYLAKDELSYADIENKIIVTLQRLKEELEKTN